MSARRDIVLNELWPRAVCCWNVAPGNVWTRFSYISRRQNTNLPIKICRHRNSIMRQGDAFTEAGISYHQDSCTSLFDDAQGCPLATILAVEIEVIWSNAGMQGKIKKNR